MADEVWRRDEIESPCQNVCVVHPQARICVGCHRTIDEIRVWSRLTPEQRRAVMDDLPNRGALLTARRGGRRGRADRTPPTG